MSRRESETAELRGPLGAEGHQAGREWWVPFFVCPLPVDRRPELHRGSLADLQGHCNTSPAIPTGHQNLRMRGSSTWRLIQQVWEGPASRTCWVLWAHRAPLPEERAELVRRGSTRLQGYPIPRTCGDSGSNCALSWPGTVHAYPDYNQPAKTNQHTIHAEAKFSRLGETAISSNLWEQTQKAQQNGETE